MKFAPGRGNVKLMLQLNDGVEIWDLGKVLLSQKGRDVLASNATCFDFFICSLSERVQ